MNLYLLQGISPYNTRLFKTDGPQYELRLASATTAGTYVPFAAIHGCTTCMHVCTQEEWVTVVYRVSECVCWPGVDSRKACFTPLVLSFFFGTT